METVVGAKGQGGTERHKCIYISMLLVIHAVDVISVRRCELCAKHTLLISKLVNVLKPSLLLRNTQLLLPLSIQ